jgi:hypothetical protein
MAEEDFSDLGEVKLTHYDGTGWTSGWGRSPGSGVASTLPYQYQRTFTHSYHNNSRAAEAEDIMGHHYNNASRIPHVAHKNGLYYSPPGTSYTIVEQPSLLSTSHQTKYRVRNTVTSALATATSSSAPNRILSNTNSNSNKKRPISPEQVLKLFSSHTNARNHNIINNSNSAGSVSNKYNTNNNVNSTHTSKSALSTETHAQLQSHRHQTSDVGKLPVKTISMTRETPPGSGNHGFGICVKGGSNKPGEKNPPRCDGRSKN